MCHAIIEVKLKNENTRELKRVETKELLDKALIQYERMGTVEKVVVFLNHHTHGCREVWEDSMYKEPSTVEAAP